MVTEGMSMPRSKTKRKAGRKSDYREATPEQVAEAVLRFLAQPGMKSKRFANPSGG